MGTIPRITRITDSQTVRKNDGTFVQYYLFPEYEVHYNELPAGSTQQWHHHESIEETILIVSGTVGLFWLDENERREDRLERGDIVRLGSAPHTLCNKSKATATFIVFKLVLDGIDKRAIFKNDKQLDDAPPSTAY